MHRRILPVVAVIAALLTATVPAGADSDKVDRYHRLQATGTWSTSAPTRSGADRGPGNLPG